MTIHAFRSDLRDELVARASADWQLAESFFARVAADQRLAAELGALLANPATPLLMVLPYWQARPEEGGRLVEVVADNARWLGRVVAESGWPGLSVVGADGADAAWLLAQHDDLANDRRRRWVRPLANAVRLGDADPRHLACLVDRIAVVDGAPQTYGTVAGIEGDEVVFAHPLRDPSTLNRRRRAIGLPTIEADAALMRRGEIITFGPDRQEHRLTRWPAETDPPADSARAC